jgi:hypothetical protein
MTHPSSRAFSARCRPPYSPCSSPASPAKTTVLSNPRSPARWRCCVRTRAASMVPAIPLALSLAPGLSDAVASSGSETRLSMSPLMMT